MDVKQQIEEYSKQRAELLNNSLRDGLESYLGRVPSREEVMDNCHKKGYDNHPGIEELYWKDELILTIKEVSTGEGMAISVDIHV